MGRSDGAGVEGCEVAGGEGLNSEPRATMSYDPPCPQQWSSTRQTLSLPAGDWCLELDCFNTTHTHLMNQAVRRQA